MPSVRLLCCAALGHHHGPLQAVLCWLLLAPLLGSFHRRITARYLSCMAPGSGAGLAAASRTPSAHVAAAAYLPPALRPGAAGWYPEGGKVWEKYGLPKW